jgi:hypothetical protein
MEIESKKSWEFVHFDTLSHVLNKSSCKMYVFELNNFFLINRSSVAIEQSNYLKPSLSAQVAFCPEKVEPHQNPKE